MLPRGSWGASMPRAKPKPKSRAATTGGPTGGPADGGGLRYPGAGGVGPSHPVMRPPRVCGLIRAPPAGRQLLYLPLPPGPRVMGHKGRRRLVCSAASPCTARCGTQSLRLTGGPWRVCSPSNTRAPSLGPRRALHSLGLADGCCRPPLQLSDRRGRAGLSGDADDPQNFSGFGSACAWLRLAGRGVSCHCRWVAPCPGRCRT